MPDKIDITKKYKCANGAEAKLYAHELLCGAGVTFWGFSGAIRRCGFSGWETTQWMADGTMPNMPGFSLVEIKPKVRVRGWQAIYNKIDTVRYCSPIFDTRDMCMEDCRIKALTPDTMIYIDQEGDAT